MNFHTAYVQPAGKNMAQNRIKRILLIIQVRLMNLLLSERNVEGFLEHEADSGHQSLIMP